MQIQRRQESPAVPYSEGFSELLKMAEVAAASKLWGAKTATEVMSLMMLAQAYGMHPMRAVVDYDIIEGRPALKSQALMSRFLQSGGTQKIIENSDERATVEFSYKGSVLIVDWTLERARKAGLITEKKLNWQRYSRAMLLRRAQAEGVRALAPFVCDGVLVDVEAEDLEPVNPLEPLNVTSLSVQSDHVQLPAEPTVDYPLDPSWPRDAKARIGREAERLGGKVDKKTAKAIIPESSGAEFEAFVLEVVTPQSEEVAV
jgi:hypothetical protein